MNWYMTTREREIARINTIWDGTAMTGPLHHATDIEAVYAWIQERLARVEREFTLAQTPGYTLADARGEVKGAARKGPLEVVSRREAANSVRPHPHWTTQVGKFDARIMTAWMEDNT